MGLIKLHVTTFLHGFMKRCQEELKNSVECPSPSPKPYFHGVGFCHDSGAFGLGLNSDSILFCFGLDWDSSLSEKKVQKLLLELYLFKRYTVVPY